MSGLVRPSLKFFRMTLPVHSQLLDLVEMIFVKDWEFKTGMRTILAWAIHKAFWSIFSVMFSQSAENLTPASLKEKFFELIVYHLLYKLIALHSPEDPDSLLGAQTASNLGKLANPALLCDVVRKIKWPKFDIEFIAKTKPSGM